MSGILLMLFTLVFSVMLVLVNFLRHLKCSVVQ